jgi:putative RecB family exonuclease
MTWEVPDSISPSRMGVFLQCPLKFRIETMQKLPTGTGAAAVAGTAIHAALELLMLEEPVNRTPEVLAAHVEVALAAIKETEDYQSLTEEELKKFGFDAFVRRVAPRAFDLISPDTVEVAGVELRLEVDLDGWILRGIIDLAERADGLLIHDWKSGRAPSERFQSKALLGLDFYSVMASIEFDEIPKVVQLLYLDSRQTIWREPTPRSVKATSSKILAVRDAIGRACDQDDFRTSPSKLCDWCAARPYCPAHGGDPDSVPVAIRTSDVIGS